MSVELELGVRRDGRPFTVPLEALVHAAVLGPTGYGKSMLLAKLFQELVLKTDSFIAVFDPKGDLFWLLKRWCYEHNLDRRVVIIDPGERRRIVGVNPITPWPVNRGLQAAIQLDIFRRVLGSEAFAAAPLLARWLYNLLFATIESGQTFHETPLIFDYNDPSFRNAITERLPDGQVKSDLQWLNRLAAQSGQVGMARLINEQLGSSVNRVRQYTRNDYLRPMLATRERAIDPKELIDRRAIVLVHAQQRDVLAEEDQRTFVMQLVSSFLHETFRREFGQERRVPCYLFLDEAGRFNAPEVPIALNEGRAFDLHLILAHQTIAQLVDPKTNDRSLADAVATNCTLKIVFGGLPYKTAEEVAWNLYGHTLDPRRRKLTMKSWVQLHHLELMKSYGRSIARSVAKAEAHARARALALSRGRSTTTGFATVDGSGSASASGHGSGVSSGGAAFYDDKGALAGGSDTVGAMKSLTNVDIASSSFADIASAGETESEAETQIESETDIEGLSRALSRGSSETIAPVVVPDAP